MNKQIQKLYDQADKFAKENRTQNIAAPGNNYFELFHEKFAELIVRECMRICEVAEWGCITHDLNEQARGCVAAREYIAEHFGVEE
jgi:hypothetical protein